MAPKGVILNVQRFTIHDGPGIRTEFFFKGCPLRCEWCGNPESFSPLLEPGIYKTRCISEESCGLCRDVCPEKTVRIFADGKINSINRDQCSNCFECSKVCPSDSSIQWGKYMDVQECLSLIRKDKGYYDRSGGGVTVSGGEPLLQSDFVEDLFFHCKNENIHTCCESSLSVNWKAIKTIIPYTDLFISDIKHMDTRIHKKYTGVNNHKILTNLKSLIQEGKEIILRIPLIPEVNDGMENMSATADFILHQLNNKIKVLQLLSFMRLGEEKYESIGLHYKMKNTSFVREIFQEKVRDIAVYFKNRGIRCIIGTSETN